MATEESRIVRIIVRGRVQGVGFRAFVVREAERLQLEGWVRNRLDGSVETVAAGPGPLVEEFSVVLKRGPTHARVDALQIDEAEEVALLENGARRSFSVAPDF